MAKPTKPDTRKTFEVEYVTNRPWGTRFPGRKLRLLADDEYDARWLARYYKKGYERVGEVVEVALDEPA